MFENELLILLVLSKVLVSGVPITLNCPGCIVKRWPNDLTKSPTAFSSLEAKLIAYG